MGCWIERTPLLAAPPVVDWRRKDSIASRRRRQRARRVRAGLSADSDGDESDTEVPPFHTQMEAEATFDLRIVQCRPKDVARRFGDGPGLITFYGCSRCTAFVPSSSENEAFKHVLRAHGKACLPSDPDIWAVLLPIPIPDE